MAKKGRTKTRTVYRKAKSYARRISGGGRKFGDAITGAVAGGLGVLVGQRFLGNWGQPASDLAVGYFGKNDTLMTLGGRSIGAMLASGSGLGGAGGSAVAGMSTNAVLR